MRQVTLGSGAGVWKWVGDGHDRRDHNRSRQEPDDQLMGRLGVGEVLRPLRQPSELHTIPRHQRMSSRSGQRGLQPTYGVDRAPAGHQLNVLVGHDNGSACHGHANHDTDTGADRSRAMSRGPRDDASTPMARAQRGGGQHLLNGAYPVLAAGGVGARPQS